MRKTAHRDVSHTYTAKWGRRDRSDRVGGERRGKKKEKEKKEKDLAERIREEVGEETVYLLSEGKV